MPEGSNSTQESVGWPEPEVPALPSISKPLIDVFKVGGLPLALLFVATVIILAFIQKNVFEKLTGAFTFVLIFLLVASVVLFLVLSIFSYLRWKAELQVRSERYHLDGRLHEQLITAIFAYAHELATRGLKAEERNKEITDFLTSLKNITSEKP